jgi:epoxyqueuosine reductase
MKNIAAGAQEHRATTEGMNPNRTRELLEKASVLAGFDLFGVTAAELLVPEREHHLNWLRDARAGSMGWMTEDRAMQASDPGTFLSEARSVVCVALSYAGRPAGATSMGHGRISRYANGADYHEVLSQKLTRIVRAVEEIGGRARMFADTAPTMDKALAVRAGLGWQGKNTMVLHPGLGSFTFLGGLVTDLVVSSDLALVDGCGTCRACAAACPTGALRGDYTIDARLCISYLTIEHRGPIARSLRPLMGDWVFGCDVCQDVCPPVTQRQDREFPQERGNRVAFVRGILDNDAQS